MRIRPFAAIRPIPNLAARVASVPYDVVTTDEARALAAGHPESFLHVIRPEIDLPADIGPYDDAVYAKGRENLDRLIAESILRRDSTPSVFLYRQVLDHRAQIGVVCCCHVDDYPALIKTHEKTRPDKEDDRTRHLLELNAHVGPVFLTYRGHLDVQTLIESDTNSRPLYHFDAPDGVTHTVWTTADPGAYERAFGDVPCVYVADGHHRSASAARAGAARREQNPDHTGDEEYNWFLTVLFASDQLTILPYNRVVRDLGDATPDEIREHLRATGTLTPTDQAMPDRPGVFCIYLDGAWHRHEPDLARIDPTDCVASLDCEMLQRLVLDPVFGIGDPTTDERLGFVGGIRGTSDLERRVDSGEAAAAISLYPTSIDQLMTVADASVDMPPKSTWFEPKLRSGLFVHSLD